MGAEHRFTEEEVRVILARAVDLERTGAPSPEIAGGLSLTELKEVASEAGIDSALVEEAATELLTRHPPDSSKWLGPAPSTAATRLLNARLSAQDIGLLLRLTEERAHRRGSVSEALGRVRWVSQQAQLTTEVSLSDQGGRARIDVEGSYPPQMRALLQLIPGAIGFTAMVSVAAPAGLFGVSLLAAALGGGALGAAVGRGIWELVARRTSRATRALADEIAAAALELGGSQPESDAEVE